LSAIVFFLANFYRQKEIVSLPSIDNPISEGDFMKQFILILLGLFFIVSPAVADDDELYGRWYAGDWVGRAEDIDGQQVVYGLRMGSGRNMLGCILYLGKNGSDRKLFGEITDADPRDIEIRLSNGKEIDLEKIGREPNHRLKLVRKVNGTRTEVEFAKEFLPSGCI
jgi:hypothetical protein